jgi:DNA-binding SARP family transcriptional activator/predicted ATPase
MPSSLRILLFGTLQVQQDSVIRTHFSTRRQAGLLAFLALHPNRPCTREEIIRALWQDASLEVGRVRLRQELTRLRRELDPEGELFLCDRLSIRLCPGAWTSDVEQFELLAKKSDVASQLEAVTLYSNALLIDLYDEWVLGPRQYLAQLFSQTLDVLITHRQATGDLSGAISLAQRAVELDGLNEAFVSRWITLLAATGKPTLALRQAGLFAERLERELGDRPTEAFVALARSLKLPKATPAAIATNASTLFSALPLPRPLSRFFGRATELAELTELLLGETRLITILGSGGSGKTRLAIELARRLEITHTPVFFSLADTDSLSALEVRELDTQESPESLLLVIDNAEHLIAAGLPERLRVLLEQHPTLRCLVTSRSPLMLYGEQEYPLRTLPEDDAMALFVDRVQARRAGWSLTHSNTVLIQRLIERLDGLPLAIELAAASLRDNSIEQLQLDTLRTRELGVPVRHQTLRAVLESSLAPLDPRLRRIFSLLTIFRGPFSESAAAAVCEEPEIDKSLLALRDRSLIEESGTNEESGTHWRILEPLRQLGAEEVVDSEALAQRHAAYYLTLAERWSETGTGNTELSAEWGNLESAIEWGISSPNAGSIALALCCSLYNFWLYHQHRREGFCLLQRALERNSNDPELHFQALGLLSTLAENDSVAEDTHRELLRKAEEQGKPADMASCLTELGMHARRRGNLSEAVGLFNQALVLRRELDSPVQLGKILITLASGLRPLGDLEQARACLLEARALLLPIGALGFAAFSLAGLAWIAIREREIDQARASLQAAYVEIEAAGFVRDLLLITFGSALVCALSGRQDLAASLLAGIAAQEAQDGMIVSLTARQEFAFALESLDQLTASARAAADARGQEWSREMLLTTGLQALQSGFVAQRKWV